MEPPILPSLSTLGVMCGRCYPGAGDDNTLCDNCFRIVNRSGLGGGVEVEFSHIGTVETIASVCIPQLFRSPDMSQQSPALANLNPLHTGILIWGKAGRGKTYQASILTRRAIQYATERGPVISSAFQWHSSAGLFDRLRDRTKQSEPLIEQLVGARLLVLDDLGAETPTEWVRERLYRIVNERYERVRPLLVTTNLSLEQMEKKLGARITGRLAEMCNVVELDGANRRMQVVA